MVDCIQLWAVVPVISDNSLGGMTFCALCCGSLQTHCRCNWEVMGLHSTMSSEGQTAIMQLPSPRVRRIILSTNIAESSITIPYVVFGMAGL